MNVPLVLAYFLPIIFLAVFISHTGKRFVPYLLWGFIASVPVYFLHPALGAQFPELVSSSVTISADKIASVTISPLIEEFFKNLPILVPVLLGNRKNNRDILVYAMAAGIGFSIIENWVLLHGEDAAIFKIFVESFSTSLMHGCTCGIFGYGMVLIRDFHKKALPSLLLGFFMIAVLIHAFYNLNLRFFSAGTIADFFLPIFLFFFLLLCYEVDLPTLFRPDPNLREFDPPA